MIRLAYPKVPEKTITEIEAVLKSGYWTQGKKVAEFETALSEYLGVEHVIVVSSGTSALHLALLAVGIEDNDEVIIPAYCFAALGNIVKICRAKPVFVDVRREDSCIDATLLERAITKKTKAIIPVHEFGTVADMNTINSIAKQHKIKVIEDAACALGSEYFGKKAGTLSDIGCFSLHPRKIISTGEGGVLVTQDAELAEKIRMLRNHGYSMIKPATGNFRFFYNGFNYRMTEFQAVLGIEQLKEIEEIIKERERIAEFYRAELNGIEGLELPLKKPDTRHTYQSYQMLIEGNRRDDLITYLRNNGIESTIGAQFLPGLPSLKEEGCSVNDFPEARYSNQNGIVIPIGEHLEESETEKIAAEVKSFCRG